MIEFDDISFRYPSSAVLRLQQVSFRLEAGELCLVIGPTGSGKSTLLGCVNNLVPRFSGGIRSGRIRIDGRDVTELLPRELATTVGYVGQDPVAGFVTDTVEEELAYSMEQLGFGAGEMRRRVEETLDLLGIADLRHRSLRHLSGGQQQRVAIGSVLTTSPQVLVLDEPTSALDPVAGEEVLALISRLVSDLDATVLLAEHRMERVIGFADSILRLDDGRVAHGPSREMLADAPIRPPVVELGSARGWEPLPLTVREARRRAAPDRAIWRHTPPDLPSPPNATDVALRARGIIVEYPRVVAVRNVDLQLHRGEVCALMGRNGSGKSSLLWALHGAGRRDAGTVEPPTGHGLVPQTASDLLYLDRVAAECAAGDAAADSADGSTWALLHQLVPGIAADVHPRDLSEGQKLALVLAVELVAQPDVVLLDEPTRGLDYAAKQALTGIIRRLAAEGRTIVVATHDVEMVATVCDRVVVMADGEIVSDGATRDVLPGSALLATQVSKVAAPVPLLTVKEYLDAVD